MYSFGSTSRHRLSSCHPDLIAIFEMAITKTPVDFGIAVGHRSPAEQFKLYEQGRSNPGQIVTYKDGYNKLSKHNHTPSLAVDIFPWVGGQALWESEEHFILIAGVVYACAASLDIPIRWGGNWDGDGHIISDQKFIDLPHFELI